MKRLTFPFAALASALWLSACATPGETMSDNNDRYGKYEAPDHETVEKDGAFEVRRYKPYVVAKTTVAEDDFDKASREGFRRLAGYIFGGNKGKDEIAMTSPVTAEPQTADREGEKIAMTVPVSSSKADEGWRISFMMPSDYDLESLPAPNDPRVKFERVEERCRVAVQFSWLTTDDRVAKHTEQLKSWAKSKGLNVQGEPVVARYDDPFTLPWNRTNEIWFDVEDAEECATAS